MRREEYVGNTNRVMVMDAPRKRRKESLKQGWMDSIRDALKETEQSGEAKQDQVAWRLLISNIDPIKLWQFRLPRLASVFRMRH